MIHGVQVHGTSKRRKAKRKSNKLLMAEAAHEKFLKKHISGKPSSYRPEFPDLNCGPRMTSDKIAGHGPAKESLTYSGERQLLGIATMHKSNMVPIFADRKEDAKDVASMRR